MKISFIVLLLFLGHHLSYGQDLENLSRKKITIDSLGRVPKIDGFSDEDIWTNAAVTTNFIERSPNNGNPAPDSLRTEVKIAYDNFGVYFLAKMFDPEPGKIMREFTGRDEFGVADAFYVLLNGYNDRQHSMKFRVNAAGVQYDAQINNGVEDVSFNGVWKSAVKINDDGWIAEIFIPYSELRFPEKEVQEWGLNMERVFRRTETYYTWSHVDNSKASYSFFDGELFGIENIKPPVRLSFRPYISFDANNYSGNNSINLNGGMDLKYGINDAFTLDVILIPDFGQTSFDETVLNLSAFEVQYNEQRAFFTESTELFAKGDLFYSRRIGGAPIGSVDLNFNEEIIAYPVRVDLINALKISGRTDNGLGIGILNAITEKSVVNIRDTEKQELRKAVVEPFTNYNVLVLDQRFGNNSSVSLINTNVLREGHFRDANATGIYTDLVNKKNTWKYWAGVEGSWVLEDETIFGMEGQTGFGKISGKNRVEARIDFRTKEYDINDLGFSGITNYVNYTASYGYRILQPKGNFNNIYLNVRLSHQRRLEPDLFSNGVFHFNYNFTTKKFFRFGGGFETNPFGRNDIYEPRVDGRYVYVPTYYTPWIWFTTDSRKKLGLHLTSMWDMFDEEGRENLHLGLFPKYRISDKFRLNYSAQFRLADREQGFVDLIGDDIIFGQRNRNTITNSLGGDFIFNNKMALNLAVRHYFSEVYYTRFYNLEENGGLVINNSVSGDFDTTYNSWNLDLRFSWWFAPGSLVSVLYRNAVDSYIQETHQSFTGNFDYLFDQPQVNNLSLKVDFFIDYNRMKNWFSSN